MADITFVLPNLAVGGGIWTAENMAHIAAAGITHIIDAQAEFDDTPLAKPHGIKVLWCPTWDDFTEPDSENFERALTFVQESILADEKAKMLVHCAAGVHRGPMYALLVAMICGHSAEKAKTKIAVNRFIATFPDSYSRAVEKFIAKKKQSQN